jgi:urea transport system permease protein
MTVRSATETAPSCSPLTTRPSPAVRRDFPTVLLALLCIATALLAAAIPARADSLDDILAHFATDKFSDTQAAIKDLSETDLATAPAILEALATGRLLFDPATHAIYYKDSSGALFEAKSGTQASGVDEASLKHVRLNNGVRSALEAAQGTMSLLSPDPAKRMSAALAVFKSHDPASLAAVETALAKESDPRIKSAFAAARAASVGSDSTAPAAQRLAAIATIRAFTDENSITVLAGIAQSSDGAVKSAAEDAISAIQSRLALWANVQNVWYGLSLGSVLLLAAIGLAITFGVMGVINMAHGEMVMLGAYTTYVVQEWIRIHDPALFGASLFIAIPLAFLFTGLIGIAIERSIIRFLYGRPLETLLATFGLSLILQQAVRTIFGANNREVGAPAFMAGSFQVGGLEITSGRMWIIVFAALVFVLLQLVLRATSFGLRMRAVTQNRRMASSMGINTNRIDALAFGLGSGIAGMAGVALSQIDNVSPNLGQSYIIDSFMVVVFGGVGNLWGTLVAALGLGVANKVLEPFAGAVLGKIVLLVFIILFIQKRPRGLFALRGRAVET